MLKKGYVLVATPSMIKDFYFHRAVILIVDNIKDSLMGFVFNKKLDYSLNEVTGKLKKIFPLYYGGPVETDSLFFIYNSKIKLKGSIPISKHLNWGGDFDEVIKLINDNKISEKDIKFFLGYSGWSTSQFKDEVIKESWEIIKSFDLNLVLANKTEDVWRNYLDSCGYKYLIWSNSPENPNHN